MLPTSAAACCGLLRALLPGLGRGLLATSLASLAACSSGGGDTPPPANNAPQFTSAPSANSAESNTATGYRATASDADGDPLSYSISGGDDAGLFAIDSASGALSFLLAPDYENPADANRDNLYQLTLAASDGSLSAVLELSLSVSDMPEAPDNSAPQFTSAPSANSAENSTATGYRAAASDADGDPLSYSISGGADAALLTIDSASGALRFLAAPDYENPADANGDNIYQLTLSASDGSASASLAFSLSVDDVLEDPDNSAPQFTSAASANSAENSIATGYRAAASDADGDVLNYSISGGDDAGLFAIDSSSGALSFLVAPDYENPADANGDNVYQLILGASDGSASSALAFSLSVDDLLEDPQNSAPQFISAATHDSPENQLDSGYRAAAIDADGDLPNYSIAGGVDAALFAIDSVSGALSFLSAPDYENPADADGDNVFELTLAAGDGVNSDQLALSIELLDINEGDDTLFERQWHLLNTGQVNGAAAGEDVRVGDVWDRYRGHGVRLAVVDDGLEIGHPDLIGNVVPGASHDYTSADGDPTGGRHGTSVAGVAAAVGFNDLGVRGVAPAADLVGFNLLQAFNDGNQGDAMARDLQVAVSNNSWGPEDATGFLSASGSLWRAGVETAIANARDGKGTAIFWAGGNGGDVDNANYDGWANYHGVMAVAALAPDGKRASYSEAGANLLVAAPSGEYCDGSATPPTTVTTDRSGVAGYNGGANSELADIDYTQCFNGTSSAAPVVSGVAALLLDARPDLSWRDVRAILARSARQNDPGDPDWTSNGAGLTVNHKYGFGAVDLAAAIALAESWTLLPDAASPEDYVQTPNQPIADAGAGNVSGAATVGSINVVASDIDSLEFVDVVFTSDHGYSGDLEIVLTSPAGTESVLHLPHTCKNPCGAGFSAGWRFGSLRHFGEAPIGEWTLRVRDGYETDTGVFQSWQLVLRGH